MKMILVKLCDDCPYSELGGFDLKNKGKNWYSCQLLWTTGDPKNSEVEFGKIREDCPLKDYPSG